MGDNEKAMAHSLATQLSAAGVEARVAGAGVHWRVEVAHGCARALLVHCFWYERAISGLMLGMNEPRRRPALLPLWLLSSGRPERLISSWSFRPQPGWPAGFYRTGPGLATWLVVMPELERARETLPLRLFGDDEMRLEVARELGQMKRCRQMPPRGCTRRHGEQEMHCVMETVGRAGS